ncbi:hypothetical protein P5V15_002746 [Pogonomyrmex californicus]
MSVNLPKQPLQTQTGSHEMLHGELGPLGQKYMGLLLGDDIDKTIDNVYGVYFDKSDTVIDDKKFNVNKNDSIIIDNVRYNGTSELYELIFKRLLDEAIFIEDDKQTYKNILLTTNT